MQMSYPDLENLDPILLEIETENDELEEIKYRRETNEYENILKGPKRDNAFYSTK